MANRLNLGRAFHIEPPSGPYCYIDDEVPVIKMARYFYVSRHSLNPLLYIDYKKLRQIVATFDTLFPGGEDTLTKMTGLSYLADRLDCLIADVERKLPRSLDVLIPPPDKRAPSGHVWAYERVRDLMRSPTLKTMLTSPTSFAFPPDAVILCRVNRRELTDFDATAITLFLMATYPGQIIVPDFGFYGRDFHAALLREERLIAGVRSLKRIERKYPDLHYELLMIEDKVVAGALYADAVLLAEQSGLRPNRDIDDNPYNRFIDAAMRMPPPQEPVPLWVPPPLTERPIKQERQWKPSNRDIYA